MQQKRIIRIDASALKHSSCIRRLYLEIVEGYRGKKQTNDLLYGTAFHKCVEVFYKTDGDVNAANLAAITYFLDNKDKYEVKKGAEYLHEGHLAQSCIKFFQQVKTNPIFTGVEILRIGGKAISETKFSIPIHSDDKVDVLLQGTIDGLYKLRSGCICVGDWKTTRSRYPEDYMRGYKMSVQMRTYVWALRWLIRQNPESELAQVVNSFPKVGIFIYGAFLTSKDTEFLRSDVEFFSNKELYQYEVLMRGIVDKLLASNFDNLPPEGMINDTCRSPYGSPCPYFGACSSIISMEDEEADRVFKSHLQNHFVKVEYKPLEFGGGKET